MSEVRTTLYFYNWSGKRFTTKKYRYRSVVFRLKKKNEGKCAKLLSTGSRIIFMLIKIISTGTSTGLMEKTFKLQNFKKEKMEIPVRSGWKKHLMDPDIRDKSVSLLLTSSSSSSSSSNISWTVSNSTWTRWPSKSTVSTWLSELVPATNGTLTQERWKVSLISNTKTVQSSRDKIIY